MDINGMGVSGGPPRSISRNPFLRPNTGHSEQMQTQPISQSAIGFFNDMSRADIFSSNFTGTSENHQLGGNVIVHNYMGLPTPPSTPASSSNSTCDPGGSRQSSPSASPSFPRATAQNLEINLPPDAPHHSEAYAKLLMPKRRGIPLWDPEPKRNLPAAYRRTGVQIGDVGLVTPRGDFDFLFNICARADDEINERGVPEGFEPVSICQNDIYQKNFAWQYCANGSVQALDDQTCLSPFQISFEGRAERGAVLVLPEGGMEEDYEGPNILFEYAGRNAQSWYEFANKVRNRDAFNGSLYLVTGSTKARSWGTAVWQGAIGDGTIPLKFSESPANNASFTYPFSWDSSRIQDTTSQGPQSSDSEPIAARLANQSVFLRGYTVMLARKSWTELVKSVELKSVTGSPTISLPCQVAQGSSGMVPSEGSFNPHWTQVRGFFEDQQAGSPTRHTRLSSVGPPSERNATARVAIVHDNIWCSVVQESEASLPPVHELLTRVFKRYKPRIPTYYAESRQDPTPALEGVINKIDGEFTAGGSSDSGLQHSLHWQDSSSEVMAVTRPAVESAFGWINTGNVQDRPALRIYWLGSRSWVVPQGQFSHIGSSQAGSSSNIYPLTIGESEVSTPYPVASPLIVNTSALSPLSVGWPPFDPGSSSPSYSPEVWDSTFDSSSIQVENPGTTPSLAIPRLQVGTLATRDATLRCRIRSSSARLFSCEIPGCGQDFTRKKNLMNHMNSHYGIRPLTCPSCGQTFTTKHTMVRHNNAKHREEVELQDSPTPTSGKLASPVTQSRSSVSFRPAREPRLIATPAIHKDPKSTYPPPWVSHSNVESDTLASFDFEVPVKPSLAHASKALPSPDTQSKHRSRKSESIRDGQHNLSATARIMPNILHKSRPVRPDNSYVLPFSSPAAWGLAVHASDSLM